MKTRMWRFIIAAAVFYAAASFLTWGFLNADLRGNKVDFNYRCAAEDGRQTLAMAAGISLIPVFWFLSPFLTGFYQHGWTLEHGAWGACARRNEKS